jgi:hypothetical protein
MYIKRSRWTILLQLLYQQLLIERPLMEIISVFCRWDRANDAGKREHWKQFPEDHKMLLFIPDDKMCLYDTPEAKHWPKLSQIGYAYLGSDRHSIEILTRALSTLSND